MIISIFIFPANSSVHNLCRRLTSNAELSLLPFIKQESCCCQIQFEKAFCCLYFSSTDIYSVYELNEARMWVAMTLTFQNKLFGCHKIIVTMLNIHVWTYLPRTLFVKTVITICYYMNIFLSKQYYQIQSTTAPLQYGQY